MIEKIGLLLIESSEKDLKIYCILCLAEIIPLSPSNNYTKFIIDKIKKEILNENIEISYTSIHAITQIIISCDLHTNVIVDRLLIESLASILANSSLIKLKLISLSLIKIICQKGYFHVF